MLVAPEAREERRVPSVDGVNFKLRCQAVFSFTDLDVVPLILFRRKRLAIFAPAYGQRLLAENFALNVGRVALLQRLRAEGSLEVSRYVNFELDNFADPGSDAITGLAQIEAGVVALGFAHHERTVFKCVYVRVADDDFVLRRP